MAKQKSDDAMDESSDNDDDDDDPVVQELDVVFTHTDNNLYLLQYPGLAVHQTLTTPSAANYKPRHDLLTVRHFVRDYQSTTIPVATHCCLGRIDQTQQTLELVNVSHILQMRPSFAHLVEDGDTDTDHAQQPSHTNPSESEQRKVTFQRKESDRAALARKTSWHFKKTSMAMEKDIPLTVVSLRNKKDVEQPPNTKTTIAPSIFAKAPPTTVNGGQASYYLQSLNYTKKKKMNSDQTADTEGSVPMEVTEVAASTNTTTTTTSIKQLVEVLSHGGPVPYSLLQSRFLKDETTNLLECLNTVAVNCRGNWLLHSHFMNHLTNAQKHVRTLLLYLLQTNHGTIVRSQLPVSNDHNCLQPLLEMVARPTRDGYWKVKVHDDTAFIQQHADVMALHQAYWDRQGQRYRQELNAYYNSSQGLG